VTAITSKKVTSKKVTGKKVTGKKVTGIEMIHMVYKVIFVPTGQFYVGKYSTNNMKDGCLGSGLLIKDLQQRYAPSKFKKEILATFKTSVEAYAYEAAIVDRKFLENPNVLNMILGGDGQKTLKYLKFAGKHKAYLKLKAEMKNFEIHKDKEIKKVQIRKDPLRKLKQYLRANNLFDQLEDLENGRMKKKTKNKFINKMIKNAQIKKSKQVFEKEFVFKK